MGIMYTFPTSWTDKEMDWSVPDPFRADYWNALALAIFERMHIETAYTSNFGDDVPQFVSPGEFCSARKVQLIRNSILRLMQSGENWLSPDFVRSGVCEHPEIMPPVPEWEYRRGDYITPAFLWRKYGISLRIPNADHIDAQQVRGSFADEYRRFLVEARKALDLLTIWRSDSGNFPVMKYTPKSRTLNLYTSAYGGSYGEAWTVSRADIVQKFASAQYRESAGSPSSELYAGLTASTLSGVGVSASVGIMDQIITSPKRNTHCDFKVWQMYRAEVSDDWGTGVQDTTSLGHELCKELGTSNDAELAPFFDPFPDRLPVLPSTFPETYPYTYTAPGIKISLGPLLADFAIPAGFQFRPE